MEEHTFWDINQTIMSCEPAMDERDGWSGRDNPFCDGRMGLYIVSRAVYLG